MKLVIPAPSSHFPPTHRHPRAMALMASIMMLVLIGAAVLAMSTAFSTEARRTRAAITGPQLRQFLLAGASIARTELQQHGPAARDIPLGLPLPDASASLHITPIDTTEASVRITAAWHEARASQTLHLTRTPDNTWTITSAILQ